MTETSPTIQVYVNQENHITFTCPACTKPSSIKVDDLKKKISPLKVRCICNTVINLDIDYRVYYRKKTNFAGTYRSVVPHGIREEDILIVNISKEGIRFRVFTGQKIKIGNRLEIKFDLDDRKKSHLCKEVEVISVDQDYIGCRFMDPKIYEQSLGYYLQK